MGDGLKQVTSLTFSTDGAVAALGSSDGKVRLWDVMKKQPALPGGDLQVHDGKVVDLTLSADKKVVAAVDKAGLIEGMGRGEGEGAAGAEGVHGAEPAGDGVRAESGRVAAGDGRRGRRGAAVDAADGKELRSWNFAVSAQPEQLFVRALAFTPDGKQLVTGNANTTMYLLDCP